MDELQDSGFQDLRQEEDYFEYLAWLERRARDRNVLGNLGHTAHGLHLAVRSTLDFFRLVLLWELRDPSHPLAFRSLSPWPDFQSVVQGFREAHRNPLGRTDYRKHLTNLRQDHHLSSSLGNKRAKLSNSIPDLHRAYDNLLKGWTNELAMVVSITPNWQMVQAYYAMLAYTTALLRFHNPQLGDTSGHNDLWCKYIAGLRNYSIRAVLPRPFCSIAQFSISPGGMFGWDWDNNPAEFGFLLEMMGDLLREVAQKSVDAQTGDLSFFHFFHYFSELYRYYTVLPTIFTRSRRLRDFRPSLTNLFNVLALSVEYTFLRVFPEVFVVFASEFLTSLRTDGITRSTPLQFRVELYCKQGLIPEEYSKGSQECEWARQIQKQMTIRMEHEFPTRPILAEAYQKRGAGWR